MTALAVSGSPHTHFQSLPPTKKILIQIHALDQRYVVSYDTDSDDREQFVDTFENKIQFTK